MDLHETRCPQCDESLDPRRRRGWLTAVLVVICGSAAGGIWFLQRPTGEHPGKRAGEDTARAAESDRDRLQTPAAAPAGARLAVRNRSDAGATREPRTSPFFAAYREDKTPVKLLALDHEGPRELMHFCIPASRLPTRQGLVTENGTPYTAVIWERRSDLVLLLGPRPDPLPKDLRPLPTRDPRSLRPGEELAVWTHDAAETRPVQRVGFGARLEFDRAVPNGAVVVDGDGLGLAWIAGAEGLPLHAIAPWKDWWNGRPLAEVQVEIRAADPEAVLADARQLLESESTTVERAERAIELLNRSQHLAQDRAGIEAFARLTRFAHRQRIRLISEVSGVQALQQARESLNILGSDPDILSDAIELAMEYGDPSEALGFYQSLLANSADHAHKLRDRLGGSLRLRAEGLLRDDQPQNAARLLADAVRTLPDRADLRILYAQALRRLGDAVGARIQADEAARLDPSYAQKARSYAAPTEVEGRRRRIEIRYDPAAGAIDVDGRVGEQALGLVVDTGASFTTVPTAVARSLNLLSSKNPLAEVTTASGVVKAQQVELPSLTIAGQITVHKVKALVLDLPGNLSGKGLLGLNVLGRLNMQLDSRQGRLILWAPHRR